MEKTLADIEEDIASLHANASKYRQLAEEGMAADQKRIAAKLIEMVAELENRASPIVEQPWRSCVGPIDSDARDLPPGLLNVCPILH